VTATADRPDPLAGVVLRTPVLDDAMRWARFAATERARTYAAQMPPWFAAHELAQAERDAAAWSSAPTDDVGSRLLAERSGEVVGVAETVSAPASWEVGLGLVPPPAPVLLELLYLHPDLHGTGLAARMLARVLPPGPVYLWLIDGNVRAERFYARRGFRSLDEQVSTGDTWGNIGMHRMVRD
jgi:diamine N-acetyltransferase